MFEWFSFYFHFIFIYTMSRDESGDGDRQQQLENDLSRCVTFSYSKFEQNHRRYGEFFWLSKLVRRSYAELSHSSFHLIVCVLCVHNFWRMGMSACVSSDIIAWHYDEFYQIFLNWLIQWLIFALPSNRCLLANWNHINFHVVFNF